jgi:hypothetical protein
MEVLLRGDSIFHVKDLISQDLCHRCIELYERDPGKHAGYTASAGGETALHRQSLKIKPLAGDALFYPPFWTHMRCGEIPRSGDKYVISSFLRFVLPEAGLVPPAERA